MSFFEIGTAIAATIITTIIYFIYPVFDVKGVLITFAIAYIALWIYFIPVRIAENKNHPYKTPIVILTIFAGWSGVLWIAALIWCFIDHEKS